MRSGTVNSTLTRGYGTLGGLGIIGAALFAVPSTLLLEPQPPAEAYLSTLAAITTGLVCIALPWERLDPRWLHVFGALATIEAAWGVAEFGQAYMAFYFLIAVSIAYVTPDARTLWPHLLLIGLVSFGPVLYGPEPPRDALQVALVVYPLLVLTAGVFAYLRQRMVADHRSYRRFAEETLALADRIAGRSPSAPKPAVGGELADLPDWSRFRVSARASAVAAAIFAIPLISAGLAVAGVKLPGFAADTFFDVGIDLPNQDAPREPAETARSHGEPLPVDRRLADSSEARQESEDEPTADGGGAGPSTGQGGDGEDVTSTEATGGVAGESAAPSPTGSSAPAEEPSSASGSGGEGSSPPGGTQSSSSLGHALEDTLAGLGGLLGTRDREAGEMSAE